MVGLKCQEAGENLEVVARAVEGDGGPTGAGGGRGGGVFDDGTDGGDEAALAADFIMRGDKLDIAFVFGAVLAVEVGACFPDAVAAECGGDFVAEALGIFRAEEAVESAAFEAEAGPAEELLGGGIEAGDASAVVGEDDGGGETAQPGEDAAGGLLAGGDGGEVAQHEAEAAFAARHGERDHAGFDEARFAAGGEDGVEFAARFRAGIFAEAFDHDVHRQEVGDGGNGFLEGAP